jgi:hypothetical protein
MEEMGHRSQGAKGLIAPCDVSWPCWLTAPLASIVKDGGFGKYVHHRELYPVDAPSCVPTATLCIRFNYVVTYYRAAAFPQQLLTKSHSGREDQGAPMTQTEFHVRAWKGAKAKARELGWIV